MDKQSWLQVASWKVWMTSKLSGGVYAPFFSSLFASPSDYSECPASQFEVIIFPAPLVPSDVLASKQESRAVLGQSRGPSVSVHLVWLTSDSVGNYVWVGRV